MKVLYFAALMTMMLRPLNLAFALLALFASGCASGGWGFRETAFVPEFEHFEIGYVEGSERALSNANWEVDNYHRDGAGTLRANGGDAYSVRYSFDTNHDGTTDRNVTRPIYDLRLLNRGDGSTIFVRSLPLGHTLEDRTLENLAHSYVEAVAGTTVVAVTLTDGVVGAARTRATRIVSERELALDRRRAYEVVFDVVDLDQREVDANAVASRVRIVLGRPGDSYLYRANAWVTVPMVVVLGYSARPQDFDAHAADFEDLLERFRWSRAGGTVTPAVQSEPASSGAPATSQSATSAPVQPVQ